MVTLRAKSVGIQTDPFYFVATLLQSTRDQVAITAGLSIPPTEGMQLQTLSHSIATSQCGYWGRSNVEQVLVLYSSIQSSSMWLGFSA